MEMDWIGFGKLMDGGFHDGACVWEWAWSGLGRERGGDGELWRVWVVSFFTIRVLDGILNVILDR